MGRGEERTTGRKPHHARRGDPAAHPRARSPWSPAAAGETPPKGRSLKGRRFKYILKKIINSILLVA